MKRENEIASGVVVGDDSERKEDGLWNWKCQSIMVIGASWVKR